MRVLGIDPGIGRTGIALIDGRATDLKLVDAFTIETVPQTQMPARLASLLSQIEEIVGRFTPDVASVETLLFSTNRSTAVHVAQARGVILCALGNKGVACVEYSPNQVKEAVAGFGGAKKPQVAAMTLRLLGIAELKGPDDTADACAVAICHHHRARLGVAKPALATKTKTAPWLQAAVDAALARSQRDA